MAFGVMSFLGFGFTGVQFQNRPRSHNYWLVHLWGYLRTGLVGLRRPHPGRDPDPAGDAGGRDSAGGFPGFCLCAGSWPAVDLIATFFSRLGTGTRFWRFLRGRGFTVRIFGRELYLHTTSMLSGMLLIVMGLLLASGRLTMITQVAAASNFSTWIVDVEENMRSLLGLDESNCKNLCQHSSEFHDRDHKIHHPILVYSTIWCSGLQTGQEVLRRAAPAVHQYRYRA